MYIYWRVWLPNLDCEVLLLDVAADMGFNGFPSPKVFLITPTTQLCITFNKTKKEKPNFKIGCQVLPYE